MISLRTSSILNKKGWARIWFLLLIIFGVLLVTVSFYPGYLSFDSLEQLKQARSGMFTDWHPPLMSFIWYLFDRIMPGPVGMLLFHNLMFWSGLALFISQFINHKLLATIIIFSIGFSPPVIALLGTIWKDVGLASALLLAVALLCCAQQTGRKSYWLAALLPLFYGLSVRHNGVFAVFPLAIWTGFLACNQLRGQFLWATQKPAVLAIVLGLLILMLLVVSSQIINRGLIQGRKTYVIQTLLLHDLAAISIAQDQLYIPTYASKGVNLEELRTIYTPREVVPLFCCNSAPHHLIMTNNEVNVLQLEKAWLNAIASHPKSYLTHRIAVFKALLGIGQNTVCLPFQSGIDPNSLGLIVRPSRLNRALAWRLERLHDSLLFRGWLYLTLLIGLLLVAALPGLRQNKAIVISLGSSGMLYALTYFFIAPTCDFRMYWWTVVVTLILPVPIFASLLNRISLQRHSALLRSFFFLS